MPDLHCEVITTSIAEHFNLMLEHESFTPKSQLPVPKIELCPIYRTGSC